MAGTKGRKVIVNGQPRVAQEAEAGLDRPAASSRATTENPSGSPNAIRLAAFPALVGVGVGRRCNGDALASRWLDDIWSRLERLVGHDTIDIWHAKLQKGDTCDPCEYIPVRMFWKAASTFPPSKADVSMKLRPFSAENDFASSVGTARRCLRSDLLPTSMMTMFCARA